MSYISFLHQTTTSSASRYFGKCCLISLFYIKPQPQAGINPLSLRCLISLFYIKPQLNPQPYYERICCLISLFYIKPQPCHPCRSRPAGCLISLFYIKPQLDNLAVMIDSVVLYLFSTSNHNIYLIICSYSETCDFLRIYEVVDIIFIPCKITKKILIAMGLVLIFSQLLPKCE